MFCPCPVRGGGWHPSTLIRRPSGRLFQRRRKWGGLQEQVGDTASVCAHRPCVLIGAALGGR